MENKRKPRLLRCSVVTLVALLLSLWVPVHTSRSDGPVAGKEPDQSNCALVLCDTEAIGGKVPPTILTDGVWDLLTLLDEATGKLLLDKLLGTTRAAERIAKAIEAGEIRVRLLSDERFDRIHHNKGGKNAAWAFADGRTIYIRKSSPSLLSDVVHEGTHALDHLSGVERNRRQLELRAYVNEWQFQKTTHTSTQFSSLAQLVIFVYTRY